MWTIYNNYLSKSFIIIFFFTAYVTEISRERFSAIILSLTLKLFTFFVKLNPSALVQTFIVTLKKS